MPVSWPSSKRVDLERHPPASSDACCSRLVVAPASQTMRSGGALHVPGTRCAQPFFFAAQQRCSVGAIVVSLARPRARFDFSLARSRARFGRASSGVIVRLALCAAFTSSLLGACSLAVDADRLQCAADVDCRQRGEAFADTVCMAGSCREPSCRGASCAGNVEPSAPDACVGASCQTDAQVRDASRPSRDAAKPVEIVDSGTPESSMQTDAQVVSELPPPVVIPVDAGMPECVLDSDCERNGKGAFCVDSVCWSDMNLNRCAVDDDCTARPRARSRR
ncbi:MAG: hypothetical protein RLZZ450_6153 [Pseudomonadota bacterium]